MEFFLSFLMWLFGPAFNTPQTNQADAKYNQQSLRNQQTQTNPQVGTESFETRRTTGSTRLQHTIIIFEDTHVRPKKKN